MGLCAVVWTSLEWFELFGVVWNSVEKCGTDHPVVWTCSGGASWVEDVCTEECGDWRHFDREHCDDGN